MLKRYERPYAAFIIAPPVSDRPWALSGFELEDHRLIKRHGDPVNLSRTVGGKRLEQYQITRLSRPDRRLHDVPVKFDVDWFAMLMATEVAASRGVELRQRTPF